jgi:glucose-6-phosphate dehydrogenase assembly protein OpcA
MSALPPSSIPNRTTGLTPEAIERTLNELWHEITDVDERATQVRMLNLLVYLPTSPPPEVRNAISTVAVQHPGRTIMLLQDEGQPRVEATIACRIGAATNGGKQACGEQIVLQGLVGGHPLHSLAVSLLQAGLPVTVWWHGPVDFDNHVFQQFAKAADRIILDSRTWTDALLQLDRLAGMISIGSPHLHFTDLQWVSLMPWRRLIAHVFDIPAAREALPDFNEVVIEYGDPHRANVGALLLAGWLMSRLGWTIGSGQVVHDASGWVIPLRQEQGGRELVLTIRHRDAGEGIGAVQMRSNTAGRIALEVTPDDANVKTEVILGRGAPLVQYSRLQRGGPAELLIEELGFATNDIVYNTALAAAARLARTVQGQPD